MTTGHEQQCSIAGRGRALHVEGRISRIKGRQRIVRVAAGEREPHPSREVADGFRAQLTPHDARVLHRQGRDFVHVAMDEDADNAAADEEPIHRMVEGT